MTSYLSYVNEGRFEELFEELGWGYVPQGVTPITVTVEEGKPFTAKPVADQSGLRVWVVKADELPNVSEQRIIDTEVQKISQLRLLIFTDGTRQSWRWPRRGATAATNTKLLHHRYIAGDEDLSEDLERRLRMIELPIGETIGILEIQERMAKAFNDEAVKRSKKASKHMEIMNQKLLDAGCDTSTASSLLVRLLFLFFGDDTNMWLDNTFQNWVLYHTTADTLTDKLIELFEVICDPELDLALSGKGKYAGTEYENFRRIDGMYRERIELPPLTEDFRQEVLKAGEFDWAKVNPDIFGAMFQQLVDLDELRSNGEHYTSEENIMKVIEPLFLDDLRIRFEKSYDDRSALLALQDDIASLSFLDPACGCGNFLIQAYKHLRGLEYEIISRAENLELTEINAALDDAEGKRNSPKQKQLRTRLQEIESGNAMQFAENALRKSKLSMKQFYGIEINEWPAKVAATAMLLVDHLCNQAWGHSIVRLPIEETPEIICANALECDWRDLMPASAHPRYVFGNPPFVGYDDRNEQQYKDLVEVWKSKKIGRLDYVTAWFKKTADYFQDSRQQGDFSFVATNSITQGEPVVAFFEPIISSGWRLKFAYRTFVWESSGADKSASVHCVILGFTRLTISTPVIYSTSVITGEIHARPAPRGINPYLVEGPPILVRKLSNNQILSPSLPLLKNGSVAGDTSQKHKGLPGLVMSVEEAEEIRKTDPIASKYLRKFVGGEDFLKGKYRYCLWIDEYEVENAMESPIIRQRLDNVSLVRSLSTESSTVKLAQSPWRFKHIAQPDQNYLCMPRTVSEDRSYFALGYLDPDVIVSNGSFWALDPTGLIFAVGSSSMFMAWQLAVGGKLKSSPRFANTLVWNTFPLPKLIEEAELEIINAGRDILLSRQEFPDLTLKQLYDRHKMPASLVRTHAHLDEAVDSAFGIVSGGRSVFARQGVLFELYAEMTK
ncbi:DNA methyltransferase [Corynebacterium durum]|uniref:DNA methyltransferase n=1 Tax=Corynebacterium durum TaxID=61592 RepID=UPI00288C50F0|nr:DNA methyltransferase [Corynebacterium durum]